MNTNFLPLKDAKEMLRKREILSRELVDACLDQIEKYNGKLNAFIRVYLEQARERADYLDRMRARNNDYGLLFGIPVAVKDLFEIKGQPCTCGDKSRRYGPISEKTAPAVKALEDAGAIVVGSTNMHEWAFGGTSENPYYGYVNNTWGPDNISGGSSGGSAVALSAGMCFAALGTDTGGSVRIPASCTGTSALKVTAGITDGYGAYPLSWTMDTVCPMARTVEDLADPFLAICKPGIKIPAASRREDSLKGLRVGINEEYFLNPDLMQKEVYTVVKKAIESMEKAGVSLVPVHIPHIGEAQPAHQAILFSESAAVYSGELREWRKNMSPEVSQFLAFGDWVPAVNYINALRFRNVLHEEFAEAFSKVDIIVSPGISFVSPPHGKTNVEGSGENDLSLILDGAITFDFPANLIGTPALCQPCGFSADGLPVGLQLMGPAYSEMMLLDIGNCLEKEFHWYRHPQPYYDPSA